MAFRQRVDTTYADLRPTDLVIDKSGQAWPCNEVTFTHNSGWMTFWLLDPVTRIKMHEMRKVITDPVTVSRIPTQADEAAKLEAEFPPMRHASEMPEIDLSDDAPSFAEQHAALKASGNYPSTEEAVAAVEEIGGTVEAVVTAEKELHYFDPDPGSVKWCYICQKYHEDATMEDAIAAVEAIGGEVEAVVTAEEVDAAHAATDDEPVRLPPFADMDILQMRSHLYLLHGVYAQDMKSRQETIAMHDQAHVDHDAGKLNSRHIPHVHTEVK